MSTLALYLHTLRHLRPGQITSRLRFRLYRPKPDLRAAPAARPVSEAYQEPVRAAPSLTARNTFRLLNCERECATAADWHPRDMPKLWIYNLHYFDDLNARAADSRWEWHRELLARWASEIPPGYGDAWEPYPVSRRIVNWVKWTLRGNQLPAGLSHSLAVQARWLTKRLEYHLLGNHLFVNAKALLHAGLFFVGTEAEGWRTRASHVIERELREQVLEDGGHFELSPMYHAAMLEDVLDIINLHCCYSLPVPREWRETAARMQRWLEAMNHPDGQISFFNDCAFGIAPSRTELERYASRLGLPTVNTLSDATVALRDSGYVRFDLAPAVVICDCGAIGPAYQSGHAHADTLSFELSLHGQRIVVNSGTSQYGADAERQRQRGTAAHSTVVVDGQDSSEIWAGFRVARRARVVVHEVQTRTDLALDASHDGYRRLPGCNVHRRRWNLSADGLRIEDHVTGHFQSACAFFHLHPDVLAIRAGPYSIQLALREDRTTTLQFEGAAAVEIVEGSWHPVFGASVPNQHIRVRFAASTLITRFAWARAV